jgi:hypothetical protein
MDNALQIDIGAPPPISQLGSVALFLNKQLQQIVEPNINTTSPLENIQSSPCIQIPRVRLGFRESTLPQDQQCCSRRLECTTLSNATMAMACASQWLQEEQISKTLIDLSPVPSKELVLVDSIHMPIRSICSQQNLHIRRHSSLLVIRHYSGSFEQYTYRENDARNASRITSRANFELTQAIQNQQTDDDIQPWLSGFVEQHPPVVPTTEDQAPAQTAHTLLEGVGELQLKSWQPVSSEARCALCFFGLPRAYSQMVLPSIIQNVLISNARHNCDIYVHFFQQFKEGTGRKNKGGEIDPREILQLRPTAHAVIRKDNPRPIDWEQTQRFHSKISQHTWAGWNACVLSMECHNVWQCKFG